VSSSTRYLEPREVTKLTIMHCQYITTTHLEFRGVTDYEICTSSALLYGTWSQSDVQLTCSSLSQLRDEAAGLLGVLALHVTHSAP